MTAQKLDYRDVIAEAQKQGISADSPAIPVILKETNKANAVMSILSLLLGKIDAGKLIEAIVSKALGRIAGGGGKVPAPTTSTSLPPSAPAVPAPAPPVAPSAGLSYDNTDFVLAPRYYQPDGNNGRIAGKDEFEAVLRGADPMVPGSRFAGDCDILVNGQERFIAPGSPEAAALLWWPADAPDGLANTQRMRWFTEDGDDVAEIHDNADGFNPYLKIPRANDLEKGRDYQTGRLYGVFTFADGRKKETDRMASLRVKR